MRLTSPVRDLIAVVALTIAVFIFAAYFDLLNVVVRFAAEHESLQLDELIPAAIALMLGLGVFAFRRWQEVRREMAANAAAYADLRRAREATVHILGATLAARDASDQLHRDIQRLAEIVATLRQLPALSPEVYALVTEANEWLAQAELHNQELLRTVQLAVTARLESPEER